LKTEKTFKPIPVKIQKESESLENAVHLLLQACQKHGYQRKILIKTHNIQSRKLFSFNERHDENMIIVDGFEKFYEEKEKILTI
jgi:U3 small nucleolar ribonucleoprotein component